MCLFSVISRFFYFKCFAKNSFTWTIESARASGLESIRCPDFTSSLPSESRRFDFGISIWNLMNSDGNAGLAI